ncbi:MAG: phage tail sheath family protein [Bacteroidia bacterium]
MASVATAVPAFIGYTAIGTLNKPTRITSMLEFEQTFGGPAKEKFAVTITGGVIATPTFISPSPSKFFFYQCMQLYFANGGGPCWVVSCGSNVISGSMADTNFTDAIAELEKIDEPTLILFPEAVNLALTGGLPVSYGTVAKAALTQCNKLQDRFTVLDSPENDISSGTVGEYRTELGTKYLSYGAAYMPHLKTTLTYGVDEALTTTGTVVSTLTALATSDPQLYRSILAKIAETKVTLPASAAIAGVYASVDRDRGVWKAPANVSLNNVIAPTIAITEAQQGDLNVDATSGKSINAIRAFTGKGTLVWGARTLAGNDNEWRYINVRRLFITAEESIKKATEFVVFEPNDRNTWNRVKGTISNYLTNLWRDGALVGATPDQAFFVKIGLGETMTAQDILEGKLIVQIGMAASRPAEFIILQFQHKLQEG